MKIACAQMTSSKDVGSNLHEIERIMADAHSNKVDLLCLPENCLKLVKSQKDLLSIAKPADQNPYLAKLQDLAKRYHLYLSIGSMPIKFDQTQFYNRSYLIAPDGQIMGYYDKIHLFQANLSQNEIYNETLHCIAGEHETLIKTKLADIGLSICYDLRFPYLYRTLAKAGAQILLVPASFTYPTGKAHWEVLLRARAIENGCFVIASAQCGTNDDHLKTYGHSMIISPWGEVIKQAAESPEILYADIDLSDIQTARSKIPSLAHDYPH